MAAAAYDRYEGFDDAARKFVRFAKNDAAEALLGERWRQTVEILGLVEIALVQGDMAFLDGEGRRVQPNERIKIGRMETELEEKLGRPLASKTAEVKPDKDGNIPGETLEQRLDRKYRSGPLPAGYTFLEDAGGSANA